MTALQLSLFSENEPTPVSNLHARKTASGKSPQGKVLRSPVYVIEPACTTRRAASLLGISTSTLYRARIEGKAYHKAQWTAKAIRDNTWLVTHTSLNHKD